MNTSREKVNNTEELTSIMKQKEGARLQAVEPNPLVRSQTLRGMRSTTNIPEGRKTKNIRRSSYLTKTPTNRPKKLAVAAGKLARVDATLLDGPPIYFAKPPRLRPIVIVNQQKIDEPPSKNAKLRRLSFVFPPGTLSEKPRAPDAAQKNPSWKDRRCNTWHGSSPAVAAWWCPALQGTIPNHCSDESTSKPFSGA
jgi:hypothetical protein